MSIKVVSIEDDGVASLAFTGEMNALEKTLDDEVGFKALLGEDWASRKVMLDLGQATYMDSAAIGWLLSLHKAFDQGGGRLVLFGIEGNIQRVIDMMRIGRVLNLSEGKAEALARLRGKP